MLSLIAWLEFSDMVLWLDMHTDMILLLIHWFGVNTLCSNRAFSRSSLGPFLMKNWRITQSVLCVCGCGKKTVCVRAWVMQVQHIWLLAGVCLWERLWTLRRYCWIYPCTSSVLWVSLQCGASCQIDRPLLKNPTLGRICTELMKPRSSHIKSNISTCLAMA